MPAFMAIALDRLLEPGSRNLSSNPPPPPLKLGRESYEKITLPPASPALYVTPETTRLPDSPSSFTPSPYVINHKRRGPRLLKSLFHSNVGSSQPSSSTANGKEGDARIELEQEAVDIPKSQGEEIVSGFHDKKIEDGDSGNGVVGAEDLAKPVAANQEKDGDGEDFFDPQDSMSTVAEYFDALEESSSQDKTSKMESDA